MFNQKLPAFTPVTPGQEAVCRIPRYDLTLNRIVLRMGGTFTKAHLQKIEVCIGTRVVWAIDTVGAVAAGTQLDLINKYKGLFDQATNISIDFTERDFLTIAAREIGGIDMSKLTDDVYVRITIAAGAVSPTLMGYMLLTPPQGKDIEDGQLIQKLVSVPYSYANGGAQTVAFDPKGALIKRIFTTYTGAAGSATVESNLQRMTVKKNGYTIYELSSTDNKFIQQEYRKVPQAQLHVVDFTFDNNLSGALVTADAKALEFNPDFIAADNGRMYFEVLDAPFNL